MRDCWVGLFEPSHIRWEGWRFFGTLTASFEVLDALLYTYHAMLHRCVCVTCNRTSPSYGASFAAGKVCEYAAAASPKWRGWLRHTMNLRQAVHLLSSHSQCCIYYITIQPAESAAWITIATHDYHNYTHFKARASFGVIHYLRSRPLWEPPPSCQLSLMPDRGVHISLLIARRK